MHVCSPRHKDATGAWKATDTVLELLVLQTPRAIIIETIEERVAFPKQIREILVRFKRTGNGIEDACDTPLLRFCFLRRLSLLFFSLDVGDKGIKQHGHHHCSTLS
jgi:hypothetical protein